MYRDRYISWVNCAPSRWPNGIFGSNFEPEETEEKIRFVVEQISRGMAPRFWLTGPAMQPANLEECLVRSGFERKSEVTGMGLDLGDLKSDFDMPPGFEIRTVEDDRSLFDWARIVALGLFGIPETEVRFFYELMQEIKGYEWLDLFIGYYQGQPASSSTLYVSDGVAGIYHVATLPEFRNKGLGRRVTLAPLLKAREMGLRFAILQATQTGAIVYRQLGFTEYSKLGRYWLTI